MEFERINFRTVLASTLRFLGELYIKIGKTDQALEAIQNSLKLAERTNQKTEVIACRCEKAKILAQRDDWDGASSELSMIDVMSKELGLIPSMANVSEAWGEFYSLKANRCPEEHSVLMKKAREFYSRSLELWKKIDNLYQVDRIEKELDK